MMTLTAAFYARKSTKEDKADDAKSVKATRRFNRQEPTRWRPQRGRPT